MPWVDKEIRGIKYTVNVTTFVPPSDQWETRGRYRSDGSGGNSKNFNEVKNEYGGSFMFGGYWEAGAAFPYLILNPKTKGSLGCFTEDIFPYATYTISYRASNYDLGVSNLPGNSTKTYGSNLTLSSTKPTKSSYTVSFDSNGGSGVSSVNRTASFARWNTSAARNGTNYNSGATYTANANATMYTVFNEPTLGNLPSSSRTGYTFNGWYLNSSKVSSGTQISSNCKLVAGWTVNKYKVIYDAGTNGGLVDNKSTSEVSYDYNTTVNNLPVALRKGYKFLGWFDAAEGGNQITSFTVAASDRRLYAQFKVDASVKMVLPNGEIKSGAVYINDFNSNSRIKGVAWVKTDSGWKRGIS